jgi:hypothetical protein
MAVTLSANVDEKTASRVRNVAEKEHRSISNVVASALAVFTGLPKDVRDTLLEFQSQQDAKAFKRLAREIMATASRMRLESATARLALESAFGASLDGSEEIDLMEEATRLAEAASQAKPNP